MQSKNQPNSLFYFDRYESSIKYFIECFGHVMYYTLSAKDNVV